MKASARELEAEIRRLRRDRDAAERKAAAADEAGRGWRNR